MIKKIHRSKEEWQKILPPDVFAITRSEGTELPFNNAYWNNEKPGIYICSNCELILFSSEHKFESGTGWPSFWRPFNKEHVEYYVDESAGHTRTGCHCARCVSHLGHVFNDGPLPSKLRYCMNSASLKFIEETKEDEILESKIPGI